MKESLDEIIMFDCFTEMEAERVRLIKEKNKWKRELAGLINVSGLFKSLEENEDWHPIGIVDVYETDEKRSGYKSYQHVRIKDDSERLLFMKQTNTEIRGVDHYCVWQTVGHLGDDYSGYLLYPLKNGSYFKVAFYC